MPINPTMKEGKIGSSHAILAIGTANNKLADKVLKKVSVAKTSPNSHYTLFKAESAVSMEHAWHGIGSAVLAFENKSMILKDLGLEILLRLSGQRQVKLALDTFGLDEKTTIIGVAVVSKSKPELNKKILELKKEIEFKEINSEIFFRQNWKKNSGKIKKSFGITKLEISALEELDEQKAVEALAIERTALLDLE